MRYFLRQAMSWDARLCETECRRQGSLPCEIKKINFTSNVIAKKTDKYNR